MKPSIRILLVDDHDFLRRGLKAYLEKEAGCQVVGEARSAEDAYERVKDVRPDLVVLDLHLPCEDGITAAAKIKQASSLTKILILSGKSSTSSETGDVERALLAGADGFVSKEDGEHLLGPAVKALMDGHGFLSPRPATELIRGLRAAAAEPEATSAQLTERELQVLRRLAEGASYKDVAAELQISVKSVDTYRTRLTRKLGMTTREDLVSEALRLGLVRKDKS